MAKKRIVIAAALVLCCLAVILCIGAFAEKPNYESVIDEASLVYYEDADAVIDASVLIVRVKKVSEEDWAYPLGNGLFDRFTLSTVKIVEVYKSTGASKIEAGSKINILESQWTDKEYKRVHHTAGYIKMETGKEYLLFLGANPDMNYYYPLGVLYGKIPVDSDEKLFLSTEYGEIVEIVQELRNKYIA